MPKRCGDLYASGAIPVPAAVCQMYLGQKQLLDCNKLQIHRMDWSSHFYLQNREVCAAEPPAG